jgi:hypothetical protein
MVVSAMFTRALILGVTSAASSAILDWLAG